MVAQSRGSAKPRNSRAVRTILAAMTESLARRLMRDLLGPPAAGGPELVVEEGPVAGQKLALVRSVLIGRGDEAGWVLLDPDLSRVHAHVEVRADGVWLRDAGSKNGTRLDGAPVTTDEAGVRLRDGARVKLGKTTLRFRERPAGGGSTRTDTGGIDDAGPATAVPPRWPIVVAALVALAALAVAVALAFY